MDSGFFTRAAAKASHSGPRTPPVEYLHKLGERGVRDMNPSAASPNMEPTGASRPLLLVLGEAPGANEDQQGVQFVGASGRKLRDEIPNWLEAKVRWNNCVRTRPPDNRTPTLVEIECFRPSVVADIERSQPKALLAVGGVPLGWSLPHLGGGIKLARGRRFPARVGSHRCWVYPILHPAYILRVENSQRDDDVPGDEWRRLFREDLERVWSDLKALPELPPEADLRRGVRLVEDLGEVPTLLARMARDPLAFDFETNVLRPYAAGARILSVAVSNGDRTVAFPLDHPRSDVSAPARARAVGALREALLAAPEVWAHNLAFELEWLAVALESRDLMRRVSWGDTMLQGYALDERLGGLSLDYLAHQHLGLSLKQISSVDRARLEHLDLRKLLDYNALDARFTLQLARIQAAELEREGVSEVYRERLRAVPTIVLAQMKGLPVDDRQRRHFQRRLQKTIERITDQISNRPEVRQFEKRYDQRFNWASHPQLVLMFRDVLQRPEGSQHGKYSTKHEVLEQMEDVPLARLLLDLREAAKLKGTYVDALDPRSSNTAVYPDGKLHTSFKLVGTVTGRLSSDGPNVQNFPKRRNAEVRSMIAAPEGWTLVSCDYGQIEARVLGMASDDHAFCRALRNNLDVHEEWALKASRAFPALLSRRGGSLKQLRSDIKNQLVFPAFYGAGVPKICALLGIPERVGAALLEEFWEEFKGVRQWQKRLLRQYNHCGYVECLTGRRRHAPLSTNMIYNSPIQGTASDIVVDAMNRLSEAAESEDKPYLQAALNVHDDLTFLVPDEHLEPAVDRIVEEMLAVPYPWVNNIPIQVEVSVGPNWFDLEEIGRFTSKPARSV